MRTAPLAGLATAALLSGLLPAAPATAATGTATTTLTCSGSGLTTTATLTVTDSGAGAALAGLVLRRTGTPTVPGVLPASLVHRQSVVVTDATGGYLWSATTSAQPSVPLPAGTVTATLTWTLSFPTATVRARCTTAGPLARP